MISRLKNFFFQVLLYFSRFNLFSDFFVLISNLAYTV